MRTADCVLVVIALVGCSDPRPGSDETGTSGTDTAGSTSLAATSSSGGPTPGSSSAGPGPDDTNSTGDTASESTTGGEPGCSAGEPGVLFSSAEHIGTIPWPSGRGPYLQGMQSWSDQATGSIAESADDFEVPEGRCWCVTSVNVIGEFDSTPAEPEFDIAFYEDVGGLPADSPWEIETYAPTTMTPLEVEEAAIAPVSHVIDFAAPRQVATGRGWISMVGHVQSPNLFTMNLSTDTFGNLSTAYRRDRSCPEWAHVEDCYSYLPAVELAFELYGWSVACE